MIDLDLEAQELESTAEWRRSKAEQYPNDRRNSQASDLLDRLASEVRALDGTALQKRLNKKAEKCSNKVRYDWTVFSEKSSDYRRQIGFWEFPDGKDYLAALLLFL